MRILVAVDGTRYSVDVVDAVLARPWPSASLIRVLSVVEAERVLADLRAAGPGDDLRHSRMKTTEELVELVASSFTSHGLPVGTIVKPGDPREVIVNEAESWHADLIILGAYGHSGIRKWQLGSVAESVSTHAHCSVELVRKVEKRAIGQ